jgi:hypothetical protein
LLRDDDVFLGCNVTRLEDLVIRVERSHKEYHPILIAPLFLGDIEAGVKVFLLTVSHYFICKYLTDWLGNAILDMELTPLGYMNLFVENSSEVTLGNEAIT